MKIYAFSDKSMIEFIENNGFSSFSISFGKIFIGNLRFFAFSINLNTLDVFENVLEKSLR